MNYISLNFLGLSVGRFDDELLLTCCFRVNFSAQRLRIRMRLILRLASSARLRLSRGGSIASVVLIRRMVRVYMLLGLVFSPLMLF